MSGKRTGWWHGGPPIRDTHLRPPSETGAELLVAPVPDCPDKDRVTDPTKVYITNDRKAATLYAAIRGGWLYEVLPLGEMDQDPDFVYGEVDHLTSVRCESAVIMRREKLSHRERADVIDSLRLR